MLNYTLEQHVLSVWILRQQKNAQRKNVSRQTRAGASGFDLRKGASGVRGGSDRSVGGNGAPLRSVEVRKCRRGDVGERRCGELVCCRGDPGMEWTTAHPAEGASEGRCRGQRGRMLGAKRPLSRWAGARRSPSTAFLRRKAGAPPFKRAMTVAPASNASHDVHARGAGGAGRAHARSGAGIAGSLPHRRHGAAKNSATTQAIPANHTSERSAAQSSTYISAYTMRIATNAIASWST